MKIFKIFFSQKNITNKLWLKRANKRILIISIGFFILFIIIAVRLIQISQTFNSNLNNSLFTHKIVNRSAILDTNGNIIATNFVTTSVFVNPKKIKSPISTAFALSKILPSVSIKNLLNKLQSKKKFIWLYRKITPFQKKAIQKLGINGIGFMPTSTRYYPQGNLFSQLVGFVNVDNQGQKGLEKYLNKQLINQKQNIKITLDSRIQFIVRSLLKKAVDDWHALAGAGIIMDINTGEIKAMVSIPDFNPEKPYDATPNQQMNRITQGIYELGSVFKIFDVTLALNYKTVGKNELFSVDKPFTIGRFKITDFEPIKRKLTIAEIFIYSSNIGAAKIALANGIERQKAFLGKLDLLKTPQLNIPDIARPILPRNWGKTESITIAYGYGIAISPLQLVRAIAMIINGGKTITPTIFSKNQLHKLALSKSNHTVKNIHKNPNAEGFNFKKIKKSLTKKQINKKKSNALIVNQDTANYLRLLFRINAIIGTGKNANIKGYLVGGKTGTAEKLLPTGGYDKIRVLTDFVGVFPMNNPKYIVMIMVDDPQKKYSWQRPSGGLVAAPVVGKIIAKVAPILGIQSQNKDKELPGIKELKKKIKENEAKSKKKL